MSSCLGLYIEENLIKYAKVTKEREDIKVEAFGVKFYDNIGEAIDQIIAETYSYKIPVSINLSEEVYNYFYFFNLLSKNDLKKAVETEFESYCFDKGTNRDTLESRYALVPDLVDDEKIKAIYISTSKIEINRKMQEFEKYSVSNITSLPMVISNVAQINSKENIAIVNLEEKTTVTTIVDEKIYNIDVLKNSIKEVLTKISSKENSYSKAYEILKNTTIYTMEGKDLQETENEYLEDIMPKLYDIVLEIKDVVENSLNKIDKIYITGIGAVINNVDLYFQEYFTQAKCEILKPYFIPQSVKINLKDYIEVNSAIALAMSSLDYGVKGINFKSPSFKDKIPDFFKVDLGSNKNKTPKTTSKGNSKLNSTLSSLKEKFNFKMDLGSRFDKMENWMLRTSIGLLSLVIIYGVITNIITNQVNSKMESVEEVKAYTSKQIEAIKADETKLKSATNKYQDMKKNLEDLNKSINEKNSVKNIIPNLLINIQSYIPQGVTITSIENTEGRHVVINAESERYDLLGYFKGVIQTKGILTPDSVVSTSGVKQSSIVKIVIEGDMP